MIATHAPDLFWRVDCSGSHGTYDDSGNIEYCCRHKFYTEYRNYTSVYQLWRDIGSVSFDGNGTCAECVQSDTIKRTSGAEGRDGNKVVRRIG